MEHDYTKAPRLYINTPLSDGENVTPDKDQSHYLLNVMRKQDGDMLRLFNGVDGEFIGIIAQQSKKSCVITLSKQLKAQNNPAHKIHLYIAPIKKERMAFAIEKAIELGVTDIHPVITEHTQHSKLNAEKIEKQIIEAAEQCERLNIPTLHKIQKLMDTKFTNPTYVALERDESLKPFHTEQSGDISILVGPEGGWSNNERDYIKNNDIFTPVSLGENILRAETATLFMLSRIDRST